MIRGLLISLIISLSVGQLGCSNNLMNSETGIIRINNNDYVKGETMPLLKMPPGIVELPPDPYYLIPGIPQQEVKKISLVPPRVESTQANMD